MFKKHDLTLKKNNNNPNLSNNEFDFTLGHFVPFFVDLGSMKTMRLVYD